MSESAKNLAQQVVDGVRQRAREVAKEMAERIGEPMDSEKLTKAELIRLWNLQAPHDPALVQQLVQAGRHAEAVQTMHPWRNTLIGRGGPQKRTERAEQLASWAAEGEMEVTG